MKNSAKAVLIIIAAVAFLFASCSFIDDNFVWDNGLRYLWSYSEEEEENQKYNYTSELLADSHSIQIDLDNLDSNIGQKIYKNGRCYIDIGEILPYDTEQGGYRIRFYSHGPYGIFGGQLVSIMDHQIIDGVGSGNISASFVTEYNNKTYTCTLEESMGLMRNDGDMFCYYLFPQEAYESGEVPTENIGTVTITLSNLTESKWTRKFF